MDCLFQVADELVAEFADTNNYFASPDPDNPNTVKKYDYSPLSLLCYILSVMLIL